MITRLLFVAAASLFAATAHAQTPGSVDVTRLEHELALVKAKNERLTAIGNQLIAAYGKRYRRGHDDAFQFARTKFEKELQAVTEDIHNNRHEIPQQSPAAAVPTVPDPNSTTPSG